MIHVPKTSDRITENWVAVPPGHCEMGVGGGGGIGDEDRLVGLEWYSRQTGTYVEHFS